MFYSQRPKDSAVAVDIDGAMFMESPRPKMPRAVSEVDPMGKWQFGSCGL